MAGLSQVDPLALVHATAGLSRPCPATFPAAIQVVPRRPTASAPGGPVTPDADAAGAPALFHVIPSEVDSETLETLAFPIACGAALTLTFRTSFPPTCCMLEAPSTGPTGPKLDGFALGSAQFEPVRTSR